MAARGLTQVEITQVWEQKEALPTTKTMPKPRSLQRRGSPSPDSRGVDVSHADDGNGTQAEDRDRDTNAQSHRSAHAGGDDSDDDFGPGGGGGKNEFDTDDLGNAGGEALGAVKLPDWMQVSGVCAQCCWHTT